MTEGANFRHIGGKTHSLTCFDGITLDNTGNFSEMRKRLKPKREVRKKKVQKKGYETSSEKKKTKEDTDLTTYLQMREANEHTRDCWPELSNLLWLLK